MNINQAVFSILGVMITLVGLLGGFIKWYLDAKLDPISKQLDLVTSLVIQHHEDIGTLKGKIK